MGTMVRASGGFSRQNMEDEYNRGYNAGTGGAKVGTAEINDVLEGKTFTNATAVGITGKMKNRGNDNLLLQKRQADVTVPAGYYGEHHVGVVPPSGTKVLKTTESGQVDLAPYDYKYVNASAVLGNWYNVVSGRLIKNAQGASGTAGNINEYFTPTKSGLLFVVFDAIRFAKADNPPTFSDFTVSGGTLLSFSGIPEVSSGLVDKLDGAPERALGALAIAVIRVTAGQTVSWTVTRARSAAWYSWAYMINM